MYFIVYYELLPQVWYERLDRIWAGTPDDLFDLAMADTVATYPGLSIQPFRDMIDGMIMDVPGLGQERYNTFEDLYVYCYRVAGTVGLMTLPILGTAEGYTAEEATEPAVALGIALQLTNILRDVGEDLERGRIYLPLDEIAAFGLTEDDIARCQVGGPAVCTTVYTSLHFTLLRLGDAEVHQVHAVPDRACARLLRPGSPGSTHARP